MSIISPSLLGFSSVYLPNSAVRVPDASPSLASPTVSALNFFEEPAELLATQSFDHPSTRMMFADADSTLSPDESRRLRLQSLRKYMMAQHPATTEPHARAPSLVQQYVQQESSLDFSRNAELMKVMAKKVYGSVENARQAEGVDWARKLGLSLWQDLLGGRERLSFSEIIVAGRPLDLIKTRVLGLVTTRLLNLLLPVRTGSANENELVYNAALQLARSWALQLAPIVAPDPILYGRTEMPAEIKYGDAECRDFLTGVREARERGQAVDALSTNELITLGQTVYSTTRSGRDEPPTPRDLIVTVFVHNDVDEQSNRALYQKYFKTVANELLDNVPASALSKVTVKFVRKVAGVTDYVYQNSESGRSVRDFSDTLKTDAGLVYARGRNDPYRKYMLFTQNRITSSVRGVALVGGDVGIAANERDRTAAHELGHMMGATHEQSAAQPDGSHSTLYSCSSTHEQGHSQPIRFSTANIQTIRDQFVAAAPS